MNRMGIALAADSVVSIYDNGVQRKRHDSVVKLFMMSERHPVGIMVYNNASLLGIPWETIIKLFRRNLENRSFQTLEEYGEELIQYLLNSENLFPVEVQQKYFQKEFKAECFRIQKEANELYRLVPLATRIEYEEAELRDKLVEDVICNRLDRWKAKEDALGFTAKQAKEFLDTMSGEVNKIIMGMFADWNLDNSNVLRLNEIAWHLIYKRNLNFESCTGLVIGGFGEVEHFPIVQHIVVCGVYGGILKYEEPLVQKISEESPSYIESFAETEAVNDYLLGVSTKVMKEVDNAVAIIRSTPIEALQRVTGMKKVKKEELMEEVKSKSEEAAKNVEEKIRLLMYRRFGGILKVVEILPLKELAKVASTLVRLTSFEKQLSLEAETVGEPIDVAVISKGDGFIWINRKHYFRPELNHRYFRDDQQYEYPKENSYETNKGVAPAERK